MVVLLAVSVGGVRVTFGAGGAGAVGIIKGTYMSLSCASAIAFIHGSVVPCQVTLVFLTYSKSFCIALSRRDTQQCREASSFAPMDLLSCSTLSTKLAEVSLACGFNLKYHALS